ncbi:MAG: TetR/AcrR family transcriptional regulator [Desulfobacterales bacterium]|jgi:AcrR family transcriptional regulator
MPRKTQFTAENVVTAAFELVREKGLAGLSAPAVAKKMGCSTMPIYSHFENMQALEDAVVEKSWDLVMHYQSKEYTGDTWIDQAVGYVVLARDERNLFKCMFDSHNPELQYEMQKKHWQYNAERLEDYADFKNFDEEQRTRIRYARAMLSHGVATSPKTGMNRIMVENDEILAGFLTTVSRALLKGYKDLPPLEKEKRRLLDQKMEKLEGG